MNKWLIVLTLLSYVKSSYALCSYSSYGPKDYILVSDENCKNMTICAVNNTCTPYYFTTNSNSTSFYGMAAIGNMRDYPWSELYITDTPGVVLRDMALPPVVTSLGFENIPGLDLTSAKTTSWPKVETLELLSCTNLVITNKINWPVNLSSIILSNNRMNNIPQGLPPTLQSLAIQHNGLTDLNYLPEKGLTFLNLYNNSLQSVSNKDWRALTFLNLGANPIEKIANVQLSTALTFFFCKYCKLNNITVDANTAAALNALKPWGGTDDNLTGFALDKNIETDPAQCTAIGGVIQPIFQGHATLKATACVLPATSASTSTPASIAEKSSSSTNTGLIVGIVVGVVVAIGIIITIVVCLRRKKNKAQQEQSPEPYLPIFDPKSGHQPNCALEGNTQTQGTAPTYTGPTQGTGSSHGTGGRITTFMDQNVVELDVSYLRPHRLELSDLVVTSNKPLASGAFGEVWLGTYGGQQVAIKRMKSREPHQVQKFIDEIILMSQLDSNFIVKFVGASWTKPIEIECVVEYMDLGDLRSYLVNQSPSQFTWDQKYHSIVSIVRGLVYLHTYKPPIIHRDLKSRNVLLDTNKGTKLTDFGTSRVAEEDDQMTNGIGTYQWMAPEVIAGTSYSAPADIYSFGIILSEFCTHEVPYAGMRHPETGRLLAQHQLLNEVREGRLHPSFEGENVPAWVRDVAMRCLQLSEHDRPTALELSSILNRIKP